MVQLYWKPNNRPTRGTNLAVFVSIQGCILFVVLLLVFIGLTAGSSSSTSSNVLSDVISDRKSSNGRTATTIIRMDSETAPSIVKDETSTNQSKISIVFSDLDGTLIHYPKNVERFVQHYNNKNNRTMITLPPSTTGLQGIISHRTFVLCSQLRHKFRTKLVFISGMRTRTLLKRLPFLPLADAYCCEAGGRIFYPVPTNNSTNDTITNTNNVIRPLVLETTTNNNNDDDDDDDENNTLLKDRKQPFTLLEDMEWRQRMEQSTAAGADGYTGNEIIATSTGTADTSIAIEPPIPIPVQSRVGILWDYARSLQDSGIVLDLEGYSTCFRINRKQQSNVTLFDSLLLQLQQPPAPDDNKDGTRTTTLPLFPSQYLATSTNLGCIDVYPIGSGKKQCCEYLAKKFLTGTDHINTEGSSCPNDNDPAAAAAVVVVDASVLLSKYCFCMCDDDNDVEMALACQHAYIPSISSSSMKEIIQQYSDKFTVTCDDNDTFIGHDHTTTASSSTTSTTNANDDIEIDYTIATENALQLIIERIQ